MTKLQHIIGYYCYYNFYHIKSVSYRATLRWRDKVAFDTDEILTVPWFNDFSNAPFAITFNFISSRCIHWKIARVSGKNTKTCKYKIARIETMLQGFTLCFDFLYSHFQHTCYCVVVQQDCFPFSTSASLLILHAFHLVVYIFILLVYIFIFV